MNNYLLTSALWLESFVKREIQKQWYKIKEVQDKAIYFSWEIDAIARMNLWSRFGNILYYIVTEQKNIEDFDSYFEVIYSQDWEKYIPKWYEIVVKATSIKSQLWATSSLQALAKKAIVKKLVWENTLEEDENRWKIEIRILIENNTLRILLNTSWNGLHKRGYRKITWDAPLKENIAASLIILSQWKFREPLYDVFCGSGTLVIEAAMIARNIAPWIQRKFAYEEWNWIPEWLFEIERKRAEEKEFAGNYQIFASDIDRELIEIAKKNAQFAGVADTIDFSCKDYKDYFEEGISWWLVSNPPYGLRLDEVDVENIHRDIAKQFQKNKSLQGGIITSYSDFWNYGNIKYKKRKLYNGWELCYFYRKI